MTISKVPSDIWPVGTSVIYTQSKKRKDDPPVEFAAIYKGKMIHSNLHAIYITTLCRMRRVAWYSLRKNT